MSKTNRRSAIKAMTLGAGALGLSPFSTLQAETKTIDLNPKRLKNNIKHSACRWCYQNIPLEEFAENAAKIGLTGIDLLRPEEWDTVEKYGLKCSMATDTFADIVNGFNETKNHQHLQESYKPLIEKAAKRGIKNVIVFSGNRRGMDDETGFKNCVTGLKPLLEYAEERNVNLVMELLNSKVNHPDYMCDHTEWGVKLAKRTEMPNFKLLYDIYHMQIMEGDVIATIKKHHKYINHYHTGGVPGRNEINDSQELYYPAIVKAIIETGFDGYLAQEFVPTYDDKLAALKEGIKICDV
ncbi:hydroxypyruvate isomerase family protein [Zunongwangia endophytica]|uniref:Hydroxypyruvate isomerase family protein n=1 Tax=Zunongwangia endophytica TaxID=1808945 RepID=A0ABV8H977_9FLAO|nr:TIM barrel protein [Zunongwangia endophytica]MDN3593567.1 TIM barrel protein [Zunongwangia endophytica]